MKKLIGGSRVTKYETKYDKNVKCLSSLDFCLFALSV